MRVHLPRMRARSARHVDWLREVSEAGLVLEALLFFRLFGPAGGFGGRCVGASYGRDVSGQHALVAKKSTLTLLGEEIRSQRMARAITQMDLADRCGLHVTFIGGVERGQKNISILSLESIARALGVSMAELISGIERRTQR